MFNSERNADRYADRKRLTTSDYLIIQTDLLIMLKDLKRLRLDEFITMAAESGPILLDHHGSAVNIDPVRMMRIAMAAQNLIQSAEERPAEEIVTKKEPGREEETTTPCRLQNSQSEHPLQATGTGQSPVRLKDRRYEIDIPGRPKYSNR